MCVDLSEAFGNRPKGIYSQFHKRQITMSTEAAKQKIPMLARVYFIPPHPYEPTAAILVQYLPSAL